MDFTRLADLVHAALPAPLLERLAREHGALERERRIPIAPLVWALVLGALCDRKPSWAALHRHFVVATGRRVARSSFYERLTEPLARLLAELAARAMRQARRRAPGPIEAALDAQFDRALALDSSTVALRDSMRAAFRACAKAKAALKLHAVCNVLTLEPHRLRLSAAAEHDKIGFARVRTWCKGALLLFDLGYYGFERFALVASSGGFFVSRAKAGFNPRVVADRSPGPGRFAPIEGLKWREALARTQRAALDCVVRLEWGGRSAGALECRAVAIRDERGRVWTYITNLDADLWGPGEIAALYASRWQVELLYKILKDQAGLAWQPSAKEHLIRLRIDAALLGLTVCGRLCALARRADPDRVYGLARGVAALRALAPRLLASLCAPWSRRSCAWEVFAKLCRDPNLVRGRSRDVYVLNSRLADAA